eukprot:Clim_evm34s229 gene=Clim_evmTU34s229
MSLQLPSTAAPPAERLKVILKHVDSKKGKKHQNSPDRVSMALRLHFDGKYHELREEVRQYLRTAESWQDPITELAQKPLDEQRQITYQRAKEVLTLPGIAQLLQEQGEEKPGTLDKGWGLVETLAMGDPSTNVKTGVMTFLFCGAITALGSDDLRAEYFPSIANCEVTGMFCMTEEEHGSNVRGLQTQARYDPRSEEFIIHTPNDGARKYYIGNSTMGEYAVVFARLILANGDDKGPHCFLVPMRDVNTKELLPGRKVVDMGYKEGLNGVDNGVITFTEVRIPRRNLLNRYANVRPDGTYESEITSDSERFNIHIAALTGTRVALVHAANAALKVGLTIAIRYSRHRRQFGPSDPNALETPILDYQSQQMRLMPYVATVCATSCAIRELGIRLDRAMAKREFGDRSIQSLAAGLKSLSTWTMAEGLQECRECCGGQGFMTVNRISGLRCDTDVYCTFEGDNYVILQQVAKDLLAQYVDLMANKWRVMAGLSALMQTLGDAITTSNLRPRSSTVTVDMAVAAMEYMENRLMYTLARRLYKKTAAGGGTQDSLEAWNDCMDHVSLLGMTHVQHQCLQAFVRDLERCRDKAAKKIVGKILRLYATHLLYINRAWFLEQNYFGRKHVLEIRKVYIQQCATVAAVSDIICDGWAIPENCISAPIAYGGSAW